MSELASIYQLTHFTVLLQNLVGTLTYLLSMTIDSLHSHGISFLFGDAENITYDNKKKNDRIYAMKLSIISLSHN